MLTAVQTSQISFDKKVYPQILHNETLSRNVYSCISTSKAIRFEIFN